MAYLKRLPLSIMENAAFAIETNDVNFSHFSPFLSIARAHTHIRTLEHSPPLATTRHLYAAGASLQVVPEGIAANCGKLQMGDRILKVNGTDVTQATHQEAVMELLRPGDEIKLTIQHDPLPVGFQVSVIKTTNNNNNIEWKLSTFRCIWYFTNEQSTYADGVRAKKIRKHNSIGVHVYSIRMLCMAVSLSLSTNEWTQLAWKPAKSAIFEKEKSQRKKKICSIQITVYSLNLSLE